MVVIDDVVPGTTGHYAEGLYAEWSMIRAAMVTVAKAKSVISVFENIYGPACECRAVLLLRHTLAQRFHRKNFYLLNHIVLYVENIYIVLANTHAGACDRIPSSASRMTPLTVRASSSGRCQLKALLISRTLAVPSIITEPSFCGVTSSASVGDIDVVKSPTISSRDLQPSPAPECLHTR